MSRKVLDSRHSSVDCCTLQLHAWKPFHHHHSLSSSSAKTLDSPPTTKRPCRSDRATSLADAIDLSRLSLADDLLPYAAARKRRRRGSRSVSGRSSDRARCCSVGASAACSDFPLAVGTDSSGELFLSSNGDGNWSSDVSDARNPRRERRREDKESFAGAAPIGGFDSQAVDSGYGSEPGYRGDAEFGYGDEEEDDGRLLFWGDSFEDIDSAMEIVGENTFSDQKSHHRCRRKKHDIRMVDSVT